MKNKIYKVPAIISAILLLLTFFDWPYGYYNFLRLVVTAAAIYYVYCFYQLKKFNFWFWTLIGIAILFNPIVPVYLYDKSLWGFIDTIVAIFFIMLFFWIKKYKLKK